jgi:SpoVK/Ycf46/Vps4 family AAA+-type ATPase
MRPDPSVLAALEAAVNLDPTNGALRLHYAGLLLDSEHPAQALDQCAHILSSDPANRDALALAAKAADASGDKIRANGYRRLNEALGMSSAQNLIENSVPHEKQEEPVKAPPDESRKLRSAPEPDNELYDPTDDVERPNISLSDVAGLADVKRRLELSFLAPMRNPDMRKLYGKSLKGGLLLYGPPGCGKTFIARAIAGEMGAKFLSIDLTDVVDMWLGNSEKNLHGVFETARRNQPCVIFIDEIDALGRKRSQMRNNAGRSIVSQLLSELDGTGHENEGVYVMAATNSPWDVDSALRRPGRLDRTVLVLPPDEPARIAILKLNLRDRPTDGIDYAGIAARTDDYSGADLAHLCETAAEYAMEDSIRSGVTRPIRMEDIRQAFKEVKPSTMPWLETARNHVLYANDGGQYDQLGDYLRKRKMM